MRFGPFLAIGVLLISWGGAYEVSADQAVFDVPALVKAAPAGYYPPGIDSAADMVIHDKPEAALRQIKKTEAGWKKPQHPDRAAYLESLAALELGKRDEAYAALKRSLALRASNSDGQYILGKLSDNPDEKLDAFTQAVLFNRFMGISANDALIERVRVLVQKNANVMATVTLEKAIAATPNFPAARIELAKLYLLKPEKQPDALKLLRDGVSYDAANLDLKLALAQTLLVGEQRSTDRPQIEEAVKFAEEVYHARPADKQVMMVYVKTLIEAGRTQDAESVVTKGLQQLPNDPDLVRLKSQIALERQIVPTPTPTPKS